MSDQIESEEVDWRWKSVKTQRVATYGSFALVIAIWFLLGLGAGSWALFVGTATGAAIGGFVTLANAESENGLVWPTMTILTRFRWVLFLNILFLPLMVFLHEKMGVPWWRSTPIFIIMFVCSLPHFVTLNMAKQARKQRRKNQTPIIRIGS